jgi:hypothetical protein
LNGKKSSFHRPLQRTAMTRFIHTRALPTRVVPTRASAALAAFAAFAIVLLSGLSACWDAITAGKNVFPSDPVNFGDLNSPHDDYNSAFPAVLGDVWPLCFSTNRRDGKTFDVISTIVQFRMDRAVGELVVGGEFDAHAKQVAVENETLSDALRTITTPADELGPLLVPQGYRPPSQSQPNSPSVRGYALLYANNSSGNHDIYFTHNTSSGSAGSAGNASYTAPMRVPFVNSPADDAYPTLLQDSSAMLFCSNREGNFAERRREGIGAVVVRRRQMPKRLREHDRFCLEPSRWFWWI